MYFLGSLWVSGCSSWFFFGKRIFFFGSWSSSNCFFQSDFGMVIFSAVASAMRPGPHLLPSIPHSGRGIPGHQETHGDTGDRPPRHRNRKVDPADPAAPTAPRQKSFKGKSWKNSPWIFGSSLNHSESGSDVWMYRMHDLFGHEYSGEIPAMIFGYTFGPIV